MKARKVSATFRALPSFSSFAYLSRIFLSYFALSFLFFFLLLFVNQVLVLVRQLSDAGVSTASIFHLVVYALPTLLTFILPYALFLGTLLSVSDLASSNELAALSSMGISDRAIFLPFLIAAFLVASFSFFIEGSAIPQSTARYRALYAKVLTKSPQVVFSENSSRSLGPATIFVGSLSGPVASPLLIITDNSGSRETITAPRAQFLEGDHSELDLVLEKPFLIMPEGSIPQNFRTISASSLTYAFSASSFSSAQQTVSPAQLSIAAVKSGIRRQKKDLGLYRMQQESLTRQSLSAYVRYLSSASPKDLLHAQERSAQARKRVAPLAARQLLRHWQMEYLQKFAIPFVAFPFVLLGFSLGYAVRYKGRALGFLLGVLLSFSHWILVILVRFLGVSLPVFPPSVLAWLPTAILLSAGLIIALKKRLFA